MEQPEERILDPPRQDPRHLLVAPLPSYRSAYLPRIWDDLDRGDRASIPAHEAEVVAAFDRAVAILRAANELLAGGR